jgi:hypothetical protein
MVKTGSFEKPFTSAMVFVTFINILFGYYTYLSYGDCEVNAVAAASAGDKNRWALGGGDGANGGGGGWDVGQSDQLGLHGHNHSSPYGCTQSNVIDNLPLQGNFN